MPVFRVTYRPGDRRLLDDIEAETHRVEAGGWHVLRGSMIVIGLPREVVLLRVSTREATVEPLCGAHHPGGQFPRAQAVAFANSRR